MTKRDIAALACRILGLYVVIYAVGMLAYSLPGLAILFDSQSQTLERVHGVSFAAATLLPVTVGLLLLIFPDRVASCLIPKDDGTAVIATTPIKEIRIVAFAVLGADVTARALPELAQGITTVAAYFDVRTGVRGRARVLQHRIQPVRHASGIHRRAGADLVGGGPREESPRLPHLSSARFRSSPRSPKEQTTARAARQHDTRREPAPAP